MKNQARVLLMRVGTGSEQYCLEATGSRLQPRTLNRTSRVSEFAAALWRSFLQVREPLALSPGGQIRGHWESRLMDSLIARCASVDAGYSV